MRSSLLKGNRTKAMAILLALTLTLMFAMPVMAADAQTGVIQTVIIEVDQNTLVEVNIADYAEACALKNALYNYLKGANEAPKVVALKGDNKRVDLLAYATNYAEQGKNVAAALAQSPELSADTLAKVNELISFNPETGVPELKPIVEPETKLVVESVSAINKTGVTVTFAALAEALTGTTVTVTDPNGAVQPVTALDLAMGATSATFQFVTALDEVTPGTWKVNNSTYTAADPGEMVLVLEASEPELTQNAQGTAGVDITAKVMQGGQVVDNVDDMGVVNFTSTLPNLTQVQGTIEAGKTSIGFVPIQVQERVMVTIRGTVANSPIPGLNTKNAEIQIKVNPLSGETSIVQRNTITAVNATMADRVTLYFKADNFSISDLNPSNFKVNNRSDSTKPIPVKGFMAHPVNLDAVIAVLDVDNATGSGFPMHDNSRHQLVVSAGGFFEASTIPFDLEDTDHLSVISAVGSDQLTVEVSFSEPVYDGTKPSAPISQYRADDLAKYVIDGVRLSNMPGASIAVGKAIVATPQPAQAPYNTVTADNRNKVTITLPPAYALSGGQHSLQVTNVGEWAASTDSANRLITQTLTFNTMVDSTIPQAYLTQNSPEQLLITFNKQLAVFPTFTRIANAQETAGKGTSRVLLTENPYPTAKTYTVTPIAQAEARALQNAAQPAAVGLGYLIEMNEDWTKIYNTSTTNVNYWTSTVNPYTLRIDNIQDLLGNAPITDSVNGRQEITYTIARDQSGPILSDGMETRANNSDLTYTPSGANYDQLVNAVASQVWMVETNEPLQIPGLGSFLPGLTESEAQTAAGAGVPAVEIEFSKGDKQKEGKIIAVSNGNFRFLIQPKDATNVLDEVGTWQVSIAAITDDVGNAQDTKVFTVEVKGTAPTTTLPRIDWADAHWNNDITFSGVNPDEDFDWVHVKFNKDMSILGNRSVLRTQNWTVQGYDLPVGTDIVAGIPFVEGTQYDAITIKLPKDWLGTKTGGDVLVNHRDLEDAQGNVLTANRVKLDEKTLNPGAEYVVDSLISIDGHMPAGNYASNVSYTLDGAYIYGHNAVLNATNSMTIGSGADMNATLRDVTVQDLTIDVGTGSVKLLNVTVNGTLTITSGGVNSIYINGGSLKDVSVKDTDGIRIVMTNGTKVTGTFEIDDSSNNTEVKLDTSNDVKINDLTVTNVKKLYMRSQNGAALTINQIAKRLAGKVIYVNGDLVGEDTLSASEKTELQKLIGGSVVEPDPEISAEAKAVIALIEALPADIALENKEAVVAARAAYEALTAEQKEEVPAADLAKLVAAEAKIVELEEEEPKPEALVIGAVGAYDVIMGGIEIEVNDSELVENAIADDGAQKVNLRRDDKETITVSTAKVPTKLVLVDKDGKEYLVFDNTVKEELKVVDHEDLTVLAQTFVINVNNSDLVAKIIADDKEIAREDMVIEGNSIAYITKKAPKTISVVDVDGNEVLVY